MSEKPTKEPRIPDRGEAIDYVDGRIETPEFPIVPFIEGDGIGPDIWRATRLVSDAAVQKAYGADRQIQWAQVYAGEKSIELFGEWIPEETFDAIRRYRVSIKGPLTTPVGGGFRSANVRLRRSLDLYACVRPVFWVPGVPCPVRHPQKVDIVVFRENTEDVYAGIEFQSGTPEAGKLARFLEEELGSPHLAQFVDAYTDLLRTADGCVWESGGKNARGKYQIALGCKGLLYVELKARHASHDLHSALAAIVGNPAWRLIWALGAIKTLSLIHI